MSEVSKIVCKFGGFCYIYTKGKKKWCSKCKAELKEVKGKLKILKK